MGKLNLKVDLDNLTEKEREKFFELIEKSKKSFNPFERVKENERYFYINYYNEIRMSFDCRDVSDKESFDICNYFNDKEFAEHQALRELLNRKLMKFSYENGGADIEIHHSWRIYHDINDNAFYATSPVTYADVLTPLFISKEVAQRAIDEVVEPFLKEHPNFKWWG